MERMKRDATCVTCGYSVAPPICTRCATPYPPPPWVRNPEKWACPACRSRNLTDDPKHGAIWICRDCGCRKSHEAFAQPVGEVESAVAQTLVLAGRRYAKKRST